ncbi:hypothetical protein RFI_37383 [Reticulomyxa filosa]|uniref:Uncharacterized protein n=1 Tax=Reticulomyxa filosa TaxID=46433 RepID=X6LH66_RETFI|nr:hypothetical protein RFI_37383 [Reticulomyxa filosa]|eukprot:ETO00075.1 hypothetical protein RFI_37383 [Reticulomyxa filosa]
MINSKEKKQKKKSSMPFNTNNSVLENESANNDENLETARWKWGVRTGTPQGKNVQKRIVIDSFSLSFFSKKKNAKQKNFYDVITYVQNAIISTFIRHFCVNINVKEDTMKSMTFAIPVGIEATKRIQYALHWMTKALNQLRFGKIRISICIFFYFFFFVNHYQQHKQESTPFYSTCHCAWLKIMPTTCIAYNRQNEFQYIPINNVIGIIMQIDLHFDQEFAQQQKSFADMIAVVAGLFYNLKWTPDQMSSIFDYHSCNIKNYSKKQQYQFQLLQLLHFQHQYSPSAPRHEEEKDNTKQTKKKKNRKNMKTAAQFAKEKRRRAGECCSKGQHAVQALCHENQEKKVKENVIYLGIDGRCFLRLLPSPPFPKKHQGRIKIFEFVWSFFCTSNRTAFSLNLTSKKKKKIEPEPQQKVKQKKKQEKKIMEDIIYLVS